MKKRMFKVSALMLLLCGFPGWSFLAAQSTVTFRVDMSAVNKEEGAAIGLRGDVEPLSWLNTLPMTDEDGDGIYSVTVDFKDGKQGDKVLYKYMLNDTWDNDLFGTYGNREVSLCENGSFSVTDTWNVLDHFACESNLDYSLSNEFGLWVYILAGGFERGLTVEEIARDFRNFWGNDNKWMTSPEIYLYSMQFDMSRYPFGSFEVIENKSGHVVFRFLKPWDFYVENWGKDGQFMGVSADQFTEVFKAMANKTMEEKGWEFDFKDEGKYAVISVQAKE